MNFATPPHFTVVADKMEQMVQWYQEQKDKLHPVELAAQLHFQFVYIHPFIPVDVYIN